jgi:hypothetical protein
VTNPPPLPGFLRLREANDSENFVRTDIAEGKIDQDARDSICLSFKDANAPSRAQKATKVRFRRSISVFAGIDRTMVDLLQGRNTLRPGRFGDPGVLGRGVAIAFRHEVNRPLTVPLSVGEIGAILTLDPFVCSRERSCDSALYPPYQ